MKKLKFILLLTVLLTTFSCQSGKQKVQSKEEKSINEFVAHLTEVDTVLITNLINQFMEYAKNGQLESAAAMLYKADSADVWNEPIQLDNNELHQVAKMLESFPVLSYKIDYIKFYTPVKNEVKCTIVMQKGESGTPIATIKLQPTENNPTQPEIGFALEADTLFCRLGDTKLGMDKAGITITAQQLKDSLWIPKGIVGFNRLFVRTSQSALPIRMQKTAISVGNRAITLHNATMKIGRSDLTATGAIHDLYGATRHNKKLRATLTLSSKNLNCNQLIRSISFPKDTAQIETESDTTSTALKLFVIPRNIDFELQTNLNRVRYGKMVFKNVHGAIDIRNQAIHLKELSMEGMDATMRTTLIYQAQQPEQGYAGFDFKLHNINIGKLVDFIPSLDTIVPMLRSFQGTVDFNVSAESGLDSCLNIKIPSLRSAIHVEGDSLVLLDGETFAEISKKFFFKNKERNLIDSISVNISIEDGNVTVYPFVIEMDRYRAAVGGNQDLDMNFNYHISILKSPIPFKLGLNISGNLDKMKFGMGKAKYKNAVTPVEIHKVDSTIVNMGEQIVRDFKKVMRRQLPQTQASNK